MPKVKYAGIPINDLIVPALSVGQAEDFSALLSAAAPTEGELRVDHAKRMLPLIAAAVRRNYPEMSDSDIAEAIDFSTINVALRAALGMNDADAPPKTRGE